MITHKPTSQDIARHEQNHAYSRIFLELSDLRSIDFILDRSITWFGFYKKYKVRGQIYTQPDIINIEIDSIYNVGIFNAVSLLKTLLLRLDHEDANGCAKFIRLHKQMCVNNSGTHIDYGSNNNNLLGDTLHISKASYILRLVCLVSDFSHNCDLIEKLLKCLLGEHFTYMHEQYSNKHVIGTRIREGTVSDFDTIFAYCYRVRDGPFLKRREDLEFSDVWTYLELITCLPYNILREEVNRIPDACGKSLKGHYLYLTSRTKENSPAQLLISFNDATYSDDCTFACIGCYARNCIGWGDWKVRCDRHDVAFGYLGIPIEKCTFRLDQGRVSTCIESGNNVYTTTSCNEHTERNRKVSVRVGKRPVLVQSVEPAPKPSAPPLDDIDNKTESIPTVPICTICIDREVCNVFVPCGHTKCNECNILKNECHICRTTVDKILRLNLGGTY